MRRSTVVRRVLPPLLVFVLLALLASHEDDLLHRFSIQALQQAQTDFRYALQVAIWLTAAYLLNRLIAVFVWDSLVRRTMGFSPPRLLRDVSGLVVYLVAISGIISFVFRQPVTGLWATSGVAGLVIGLALRNIILDVFIGLAVNIDRPYGLGDFIMLQTGQVGRVLEINWRTTRLETNEGNTIIVPNSRIGDMVVTNFSKPNTCAEFELLFSIDFGVPSERVLRVLTAAAMAVTGAGILDDPDHEPKARIKGISHEGVEYKVKYWVDCAKVGPGKARHRVLESVLKALRQAGIAPAQPKQDVFYAPLPNRQLDTRSPKDRMELLSRIELFSVLEEPELEELALDLSQLQLNAGAAVIRQGEPGDSMFILIEGLLQAAIDFQGDGQQTHVGQVRAGEFFGEMSMLTGDPRMATITAATDVLIYQITKANMDIIFARRPELAEPMSHVVAKRRLANDGAYQRATTAEKQAHEATMATQILHKIRLFFGGTVGGGAAAEREPAVSRS